MTFKQELAELLHSYRWDETLGVPASVLAEYLRGDLQTLSNFLTARDRGGILGPLGAKLDKIEGLLIHNLKNENVIMADLTQLTADVQATLDVEQSAAKALLGIKAQLDAAGTDPVKLKALSDSLESGVTDLAKAIADTSGGEGSEADTSSPQG